MSCWGDEEKKPPSNTQSHQAFAYIRSYFFLKKCQLIIRKYVLSATDFCQLDTIFSKVKVF